MEKLKTLKNALMLNICRYF